MGRGEWDCGEGGYEEARSDKGSIRIDTGTQGQI
jgi:hypothetical protein